MDRPSREGNTSNLASLMIRRVTFKLLLVAVVFVSVLNNQPSLGNRRGGVVVNAELTLQQTSGACNINAGATPDEHVIANGHPTEICGVQISATEDSAALIQVSLNPSDTNFLYIERVEDIDCIGENRFVSIYGENLESKGPCGVALYDREFKLNLHGEVDIVVHAINVTQQQIDEFRCEDIVDTSETALTTATATVDLNHVCRVDEYHSVFLCDYKKSKFNGCKFKFPADCNVTLLHHKEVAFECADGAHAHTKSLLYYPDSTTILDFKSNHVAAIEGNAFTGLNTLEQLHLQRNQIEMLPADVFRGLKNLRFLKLSINSMETIDGSIFRDQVMMTGLHLSKNLFATLPLNLFWGLNSLATLILNAQTLSDLDPLIFKDLANLTALILASNQLTYIRPGLFDKTVALKILDLSFNLLTVVPPISHLINLEKLYVENNSLRIVHRADFSGLHELEEIIVSQPEICECYVPDVANCSTNVAQSSFLTCTRMLSDRALAAFMWLIGMSALIGNAFVLWWRHSREAKHKVQSRLILNLACSDFLMGVYMVLIASADIHFGDQFPLSAETWRTGATCRFAGFISVLSCEASVLFVTLISIDRLICIKYPNAKFKFGRRSILVAVLVCWMIGLVLSITPAILSRTNPQLYDNSHVCIGIPLSLVTSYSTHLFDKKTEIITGFKIKKKLLITQVVGDEPGMFYSTAIFIGLNSFCYVVVLVCYIVILTTIYKMSRRYGGLVQEMKDQIRLTVRVTAIVVTDFVCWVPVIVLGILVQTESITLPPSVFAWVVTFILPLNSAINPYLYTIADIIRDRRNGGTAAAGDDGCDNIIKDDRKKTPDLDVIIYDVKGGGVGGLSQEMATMPDGTEDPSYGAI